MKTQSRTATTPEPIDPKTVVRQVVTGVKHVDAERAEGYAGLLPLRASKTRALERRERLYAAKYGEKDPRVARAEQQREANERLVREIEVAHAHAETPAPKVDENSYVLHGFVRNRRREPQPCLTLALYDQQGNWVREADYATTNDQGYFLLRYQRSATTQKPARETAAKMKSPASKTASTEQTKTDAKQPSPTQQTGDSALLISTAEIHKRFYELRVYDAEQTLLHRDTMPVRPRPNQTDFREITLDDEACAPTPPPGGKNEKPSAKAKRKTSSGPRGSAKRPSKK